MTEQTVAYNWQEANQPPTNGQSFVDARVQLVIDQKKIEMWEVMAIETERVTDMMMVFARYLCRGDQPISPEIPYKPFDEMTKAELAQLKNSEAFKLLRRFNGEQLQAAAAKLKAASAGF